MADFNGGPFGDFLFGTNEDDIIFGNGGNDFLNGQGGNDLIQGGKDDDILQGDGFGFFSLKGADTLTGGTGNDAYEFSVFDGDTTALTLDVVTDFEGAGVDVGDVLQLRNSFFITGPRLSFGGLRAAPTSGTALGVAGDGVAAIFYAINGGDTLIFGDTNDDGAYDADDFTARLTGTHSVIASDFGDTDFVIPGTNGDDTINGTDGNDNIFGGAGNDTISALGGSDRVDGGSGDDIINGGDGDDAGDFPGDVALLGGDGNDRVNGNAGNDTADGGNGNDVVAGGDGDDIVGGGADDDSVSGGWGDDFVLGGAGNDSLAGGNGADALNGGAGDDVINGGAGDDSLLGDDSVNGPIGTDTLTGGAGNDQFSWSIGSNEESTTQFLDTVTDFEGAGVEGGDILFVRLPIDHNRRLTLRGQLAAMPVLNAVIPNGNDGLTDIFFAFSGSDTILFGDSNDNGRFDADDFAVRLAGHRTLVQSDFGKTDFVIGGTGGNDTLNGTDGPDTIFGLGGNDTINGLGGADNLDGGAGNDVINGGNGNDVVTGGTGNDLLNGDAGNDRINGGNANDEVNGGVGRDNLTGDAGNDVVDGGGDSDNVSGGSGNDIVRGGTGNDNVDGDRGSDLLLGGDGRDILNGGDDNDDDVLRGEEGDDILEGGDSDDSLGVDRLFGGAGDDELTGYAGTDIKEGGTGNDIFRFFQGSFSPDSIFLRPDTVNDFEGAGVAGGDAIDYEQAGPILWRGQQNIGLTIGAVLPGAGNGLHDLMYTFKNGNTWLIGDTNDDGRLDNQDSAIKFLGIRNFNEVDFTQSAEFVTVGTEGDDIIDGTDGGDKIFALGGDDQVFGNGGDDDLHGGAGDDLLDSGAGFDDLFGEAGNDTLVIREFGGFFAGGASGGLGDDVIFGSDVPFSFVRLNGDEGNDEIHAGAGGAVMFGGTGADRIIGGIGDDAMNGGPDGFTLDGEQDLFVFGATWGSDNIADFEDGMDLIDLSGSGFTFADLNIEDAFGGGGFATRITVSGNPGVGEIVLSVDPAIIDATDFVF
jgi:Ca2+-binding RTX toxin-like protein